MASFYRIDSADDLQHAMCCHFACTTVCNRSSHVTSTGSTFCKCDVIATNGFFHWLLFAIWQTSHTTHHKKKDANKSTTLEFMHHMFAITLPYTVGGVSLPLVVLQWGVQSRHGGFLPSSLGAGGPQEAYAPRPPKGAFSATVSCHAPQVFWFGLGLGKRGSSDRSW